MFGPPLKDDPIDGWFPVSVPMDGHLLQTGEIRVNFTWTSLDVNQPIKFQHLVKLCRWIETNGECPLICEIMLSTIDSVEDGRVI